MSRTTPRRSRAFFVTSSIVLSVAYFSVAVGTWLIHSGAIETSADSVNAVCTPPSQAAEAFTNYPYGTILEPNLGGAINPPDWTFESTAEHAVVNMQNISYDGSPLLAMSLKSGRGLRSVRKSSSGEVDLALFGNSIYSNIGMGSQVFGPTTITLHTETGTSWFRIWPVGHAKTKAGLNTTIEYRDSSGEWNPVPGSANGQFSLYGPAPWIQGVVTFPSTPLHISWNGSSYKLSFPGYASTSNDLPLGDGGATKVTGIGITGGYVQSINYPAGLGIPCISSVSPSTVAPGAVATLAGINLIADNAVVNGLPGGAVPLTGSATSATFTVPASTAAGTYNIYVTNALGQSGTVALTVNAPSTPPESPTVTSGTSLICAADDAKKQQTDDFEGFADHAGKDFGWNVKTFPNTSAEIRKGQGKGENGLVLYDGNSAEGYESQAEVGRAIATSESGSASFDVKPNTTASRLAFTVAGSKGTFLYAYLAPNGTFEFWDQPATFAGTQYVRVGTATYKADEWLTLKLDWNSTAKTFDMSVNGTKLNTKPLPYSYVENAAPASSIGVFTGWGQVGSNSHFTGTYALDNVVYPGCGNSLALAVTPKTGNVPLEVTANAALPNKNLLNEPYSIVSDVDAGATDLVVSRSNETGAIKLSDVPMAAQCTSKSWLRDMDANKANQLQWKRTVPSKATVEAKISWESSKAGLLQGMVGFIDANGFLHDVVGINDGSSESLGTLFAGTRNYKDDQQTCTTNVGDDGWKEATGSPVTGDSGSAIVKLVRRDKHVEIYVDGKKITEHDVTGDIAGIAVETAGLPGHDYGSFTVESLKLTNDDVAWDLGDGAKGTCIAGTKCEMPQITGDTGTVVKHTYAKAGTYTVSVSNADQQVSTTVTVTNGQAPQPSPPTPGPNPTPSPTPPDTRIDNSKNGPPPSNVKPASLVSTGGNLYVNLGLALLLSIGTSYVLLRRRHPSN